MEELLLRCGWYGAYRSPEVAFADEEVWLVDGEECGFSENDCATSDVAFCESTPASPWGGCEFERRVIRYVKAAVGLES